MPSASRAIRWLYLPTIGALVLSAFPVSSDPAPLIVHEWGTFTSLQDEAGDAIGGINTDDEPVPPFVHRLVHSLLISATEVPPIFFQGAPQCHPDVTMRLETPVLYFHGPSPQRILQAVNVQATFRGGWLSEFYPLAEATAPGVNRELARFGSLPASTMSTLAWNGLQVGGDWQGPVTTQHVWTSPRAVRAAAVRTVNGEAEDFLFYRGVAHIDAPIAVARVSKGNELELRSQLPPDLATERPLNVNSLWLVGVNARGEVAYRTVPPVALDRNGRVLTIISGRFAQDDYAEANVELLKASLHSALVTEGLFDDEAQALLRTWDLSYFRSAGLRLFFVVPRVWTDFFLPLRISVPAVLTRVMVGRIELVTPEQRTELRQIARDSVQDIKEEGSRLRDNFYARRLSDPNDLRAVDEGSESLATHGVVVPNSYRRYLSLGRFRNALILNEARVRPSPSLGEFISAYGLSGYKPQD